MPILFIIDNVGITLTIEILVASEFVLEHKECADDEKDGTEGDDKEGQAHRVLHAVKLDGGVATGGVGRHVDNLEGVGHPVGAAVDVAGHVRAVLEPVGDGANQVGAAGVAKQMADENLNRLRCASTVGFNHILLMGRKNSLITIVKTKASFQSSNIVSFSRRIFF